MAVRSSAISAISYRTRLTLRWQALRQGSFIQKMHDLGWLDLDRFSDDDTILSRCVARYHAFLDLISSAPSSFFVPTLDIVRFAFLRICKPI